MQLTGLTSGKTYEVRLYCRKYNNDNRTFPISFDAGNGNQASITYNYNQRTPHVLAFRYTPQETTLTIRFGKAAQNYDIHALTNEELTENLSLDATTKDCSAESAMLRKVLDELDVRRVDTKLLRDEEKLLQKVSGNDSRWKMLYLKACELRRQQRLANWIQQNGMDGQLKIVYTKHCVLSGPCQMHPTDMVTDHPYKEQIPDFRAGAQLRLLTLANHKVNNSDDNNSNNDNNLSDVKFTDELLLETKTGLIRDPNVSYDGTKIVFSMRHNFQTDDYHLYEMDVASREVKQLTNDVAVSDVEAAYLPDGNIVFQSTRCVQLTDCWPVPVSNLYIYNTRNKNIRRVGFDQVHTLYPQVLDNGTVIYTRWEYNDRNPVHQQPLFQMDYDGTAQQVFYGGGEYFPTAIIHSRGVPGTNKVIGVASGHHVDQRGKLIMVDRAKGMDGNSGIEFLAPRKPANLPVWQDSIFHLNDHFGQDGETFQYPFALDEDNYIVAYIPEGGAKKNSKYKIPFGLYWMNSRGERELLVYDSAISCGQPVLLATRTQPILKPSQVDLTQKTGRFYVQDVYVGKGTEGVKRGTIKSMRVVALEYRAAHVRDGRTAGQNKMFGARGSTDRVTTPIAAGSGSWDVKRILGEVPVTDDGTVFVEVPAETPVYFQLLDENGYCVQTMRSWTTLQPNETFACLGCHENKLLTFNSQRSAGNKLKLYTVNNKESSRGFSYSEMIQPIWDKHCIRCHNEKVNEKANEKVTVDDGDLPFAKIDLRGVVHSDLQNDFKGAREHPWQSNGRLYTM
jgi:transposase-like protein